MITPGPETNNTKGHHNRPFDQHHTIPAIPPDANANDGSGHIPDNHRQDKEKKMLSYLTQRDPGRAPLATDKKDQTPTEY